MDSTESFLSQQTGPTISQDRNAIFQQFEQYDWNNDDEFQNGIKGILQPMKASGSTDDQVRQTELNAKIFFFGTKSGHSFTSQDYLDWKAKSSSNVTNPTNQSQISQATSTQDQRQQIPPHPASFDAIVELISTGRTDEIPGIKEIPLKINESAPTVSSITRPPKPWERSQESSNPSDQVETASETMEH